MPMEIEFCGKAIKFLVAPPKPSHPLRDIILTLDKSHEITSLARIGRDLIRSCASARAYTPPVSEKFDLGIDNRVSDSKLASVAERSGLLKRLNIDAVAIDQVGLSRILCAYLGAAFRCSWKEQGINSIHKSINDICALILNDDGEPAVMENGSHEKMMEISGVEKVTTPAYAKADPPPNVSSPMPTRVPQSLVAEMDVNSNESVSSGRSPPPHSYGPHYQQPYQPYYPFNLSNPPPPPHPMQRIYLQSGPVPQRFTSYAPGPAPTSNPPFVVTPPQPQVGSGGYQQPSYQPMQYASSSPQGMSPQPGNMAPGGFVPPQSNPPGYGMQAQAPPAIPIPPLPSQQTQGFISLFNELAMKHRLKISWEQQKTGQQHIPEWTMWLIVDGTLRGHGTAPTKQAAKEVAARAALQAMGWLAA
ncbi:hypothetical protein FRC10_004404 [Ceratobasidium sp. 414]|nr:hypothetical protein FRC10_004404 [Ceratobasidium sp. 414]